MVAIHEESPGARIVILAAYAGRTHGQIFEEWSKGCLRALPIECSSIPAAGRNFDIWRRKRDSNPRVSHPTNGFQDLCSFACLGASCLPRSSLRSGSVTWRHCLESVADAPFYLVHAHLIHSRANKEPADFSGVALIELVGQRYDLTARMPSSRPKESSVSLACVHR